MAGSISQRPERASLLGPFPEIDTDEISSLAQTAEYDHGAPTPPLIDSRYRYRIVERIGAGGFGIVFKAWDSQLERAVAIKLLRPSAGENVAGDLLAEARTLARLDHPAIVPVYDLGHTSSDDLLIVSKYIEGRDLGSWMRSQRMTAPRAAQCIATIAEALDYAHAQGVVHRDVKPGNILLTAAGAPVLSDFGLALHDKALGSGAHFVGTPAYMSPEQARSEGHRVDGRSDIYSLGTVFYELLTGQRPFQGQTPDELLDYIRNVEPRPPRQIDRQVPRELERICLKALAKRATDRYSTAGDMAGELRDWLLTEQAPMPMQPERAVAEASVGEDPSSRAPPIVVPHGLRSFDERDADFFLHLVPGARDRAGVPESVRFWQGRIESSDPGETFRVGVLLGPSGSGKSSLVRAGIVPLLDPRIATIIVEAGPAGLEDRLRRRLARELCEGDGETLSLHDLAVCIRQQGLASGKSKLLIVIDQFEQWLNLNEGKQHTPLAEALRQCDGVSLQALLLVRDDFTIAITRFLEELEEPLLQNRNFAAIDRFSPEHAAKVLESFGQAYRAWSHQPSREHRRFIERAVQELARGGSVVPVQLAALVEIVKERPWTEATLRQVGGVHGIDVQFLEQRLVGQRSHPEIRQHLRVVRRLLAALLPAGNESIRGPAKTRTDLVAALGDAISGERLDKLLHLLDVEVRLITPAGGGTTDSTESGGSQREPAYQLTHDYLVSAVRAWLSVHELSTRGGRARLRLRELAETWNAHPAPQRLPTWLEWLAIRWATRPSEWSAQERRMMDAASRRTVSRAALGAIAMIALALVAWQATRYDRAKGLYSRLLAADTAEVPAIVGELARYDRWTLQRVRRRDPPAAFEPGASPAALRRELHKRLALADKDPQAAQYVVEHLDHVPPEHLAAVAELLRPQRSEITPLLWQRLNAAQPETRDHLPAAALLALLGDRDRAWEGLAPRLVRWLIAVRPAVLPFWLQHFSGRRGVLAPPLLQLMEHDAASLSASERSSAFEALAAFAHDDPASLAMGLERAEATDLAALWPTIVGQSVAFGAVLRKRLDQQFPAQGALGSDTKDAASELAALVRRYGGSVAPAWAYVAACPLDEFDALAGLLRSAGYAPLTLRLFALQGRTVVAAALDHSERACRWRLDVPADEVAALVDAEQQTGWCVCDLTPTPSATGDEATAWSLLFEKHATAAASRVLVNGTDSQLKELSKQFAPKGYVLERCHSALNKSGQAVYAALWRQRAASETTGTHRSRSAFAFGELYPGWCLSDVRLHEIEPGRRDAYAAAVLYDSAEQRLPSAQNSAARQATISQLAQYALARGDSAAALEWVRQLPQNATNRNRRAVAAARLGKIELVQQCIEELGPSTAAAPLVALLKMRLANLQQQHDEVPELLASVAGLDDEAAVRTTHAFAIAASAHPTPTDSQALLWQRQAIEGLDRILTAGSPTTAELEAFDPDYDAVRADAQFDAVLQKHGLTRRYDSVWQELTDYETRLLHDTGAAEHQRRAKELSEQNYRLVALDVQLDRRSDQVVLASVWRRPVISADESTASARRIARLAAGAARLGQNDMLVDVLCDRFGREARAQLIEIAPSWLPAGRMIELLRVADAPGAQRGLLLALGSCSRSALQAVDPSLLSALVQRLAVGTGEASVRAAAQWCASRCELATIAPAAPAASGGARPWYINSLGQTMVVLDPPEQFLMGSPAWEADRNTRSGAEQLHWRRIGRRYSIAATETTVTLFKEFLEDPKVKKAYAGRPFLWTERYAPTPDCPQTSVKWYDAVRFCQWLSEREGLPEAEWCYPGIWDVADDKWQLPSDLLQRRGYRLPTEAEWEYACRGGSTAARYYGYDRELLPRYAWYLNSADERSHPVGALLPNDFGLFDMLGNVFEWNQDAYGIYQTPLATYWYPDRPALAGQTRVRRGGGFETVARQLRAADRSSAPPDTNSYLNGFRVARTERP